MKPSLYSQAWESKNPQRGMKLLRMLGDVHGKCNVRMGTVPRSGWGVFVGVNINITRYATHRRDGLRGQTPINVVDGPDWWRMVPRKLKKGRSTAISPSYSPPPPSSGREKERTRARWRIYRQHRSARALDPRSRFSPSCRWRLQKYYTTALCKRPLLAPSLVIFTGY